MNGDKLGVLICGAGWVSTQHIDAYKKNPHTEIVAIASRSLESAQSRADEAGLSHVAVYDDLDHAIKQHGVDVISICTPQHLHFDNVMLGAGHKKHILIEKPAANSIDQLQKMQAAVADAGVKTLVSFVLRWNPMFMMLKRLLADGAVGNPYCVETDYMSYNGSWWPGWNDARTREQGVSAMLVGGCHAIDALRWFASTEEFAAATPVEVFGYCGGNRFGSERDGKAREYNPLANQWIDDAPPVGYEALEMLLVKFDNGVIGKVSVNAECVMPYRFPVRIFGNEGSIFDNKIWSTAKYPAQTDWVKLPTIQPDSSDVSHHPFQGEIDHFVDCIRNDTESHCNLSDAINTHRVVFAANECYRTGKPVRIEV